jgi:hypothetical protein
MYRVNGFHENSMVLSIWWLVGMAKAAGLIIDRRLFMISPQQWSRHNGNDWMDSMVMIH